MARKKPSTMWKYFTKIDNSIARCNLCSQTVKSLGTTCYMIKHFRAYHLQWNDTGKKNNRLKTSKLITKRGRRNRWQKRNDADNTDTLHAVAGTSCETMVEIQKEPPITQMSTSSSVTLGRLSTHGARQTQILDAILYYICTDYQPFNVIQQKGFKYLMKKLAPFYEIPDKTAIKKRLDEKYDIAADIFKQNLNKALHMTITIDTWSEVGSPGSFLGVKVYFIANKVKKIESGNIEVVELLEFTADCIASEILKILTKWCIDVNKVVAVVTNNEPDMINGVTRIFEQKKHITCFAYTINLVAENCLKNCKGLDKLVNKVRSIAKFVKNTDLANELHRYQIDSGVPEDATKKLILNADMKWNSIFYMIERFIGLWDAIQKILLAKHIPEYIIKCVPTDDELVTLREILNLLRPLEFMVHEYSTKNYIAASKIIPLINCAITEYQIIEQTTDLSVRLKKAILTELETRFGQIEFTTLLSIATILDPRFKTIHFRNAHALTDIVNLLCGMLSKYSSSSDESNTEQQKTRYNLWSHHKFLTHMSKKDNMSLQNELSLYLDKPLAALEDDPLERWESMRLLCPTLYIMAVKHLSIVATSIPAERPSNAGIATTRLKNRHGKHFRKLLFLNSIDQEYWS
ncbi:PREDICTED: zinc finger BED domain-containing protein 4-like [Vollenhovia emeryi]|uniref:zinc finger BED domain-containing protein 4-like n=1 Tax=Vollenhovia emeryi TaxID=411798 RepID=UPI0005F3E4B8|nr:PREDICTED: zinc finger BED domain-containing protein 4-like [Vollenhovia emeryi]